MSRLPRVFGWVLASSIALSGCLDGDDEREHARCTGTTVSYEGEIDGWRIRAPYTVRAWFSSVNPDTAQQQDSWGVALLGWGLEPDHEGDVERWRYLVSALQLENDYEQRISLGACQDEDEDQGGLQLGNGPIRQELGVFLFELAEHEVQPGTEIDVLDASSLTARLHPGKNSRRDAMRALVDDIRDDDRPYAVVVYAPDRSTDCATILPSVLLDDDAIFAGGGKVTFDQLLDEDGAAIEELVYPTSEVQWGSSAIDVRWGSFSIEAEFADGDEIAVQSKCVSFSSPNLLR